MGMFSVVALRAILVLAFLTRTTVNCFVGRALKINDVTVSIPKSSSLVRLSSTTSPTIEQLASDPFMKQVSYAAELSSQLLSDEFEEEKLVAQLSHSDGIRGFFVTYLTAEGTTTAADMEMVPPALLNAMKQANEEELIPLACMNVVMPTAMSTMHTDSQLQASSKQTAERGVRILKALLSLDPDGLAERNVRAIYTAADFTCPTAKQNTKADKEHVDYWSRFFSDYGYGEQQLQDIASVFGQVVISRL